jgi:hypothetical protein
MDGQRIKEKMLEQHCDFIMNSPSSSHMGGVWERQIRTIRSVLTGILDQAGGRLDTSSLRTFLYEAMAIVNSRPIAVDHPNDPREPAPITPNHLLTMKSGIVMPPPGNFVREDLYARKRWRKVQHLANEFWLRWKKEYLQSLQTRQKWQSKRRNIQVDDIVILQDQDLARGQWKLARVESTITDNDGLVRRVKLLIGDPHLSKQGKRRAKATFLERPIHKLILLVEKTANEV